MHRRVYVYADEGASAESINGTMQALTDILGHPHRLVSKVEARNVSAALGAQPAERTAFVMPGGADLPYLDKLAGRPVADLRACVAAGGAYVGFCAGAYFASAFCVFEPADATLRVVGPRPLRFYQGKAVGAVRGGFQYASEVGATLESLDCFWGGMGFQADVYCNGGAGWDIPAVSPSDDKSGTTVIARYTSPVLLRHGLDNPRPAAVLQQRVGEGVAVLCGVHPEIPWPSFAVRSRGISGHVDSTAVRAEDKIARRAACEAPAARAGRTRLLHAIASAASL